MNLKQDVALFVDGPLDGTWQYLEQDCPRPDEFVYRPRMQTQLPNGRIVLVKSQEEVIYRVVLKPNGDDMVYDYESVKFGFASIWIYEYVPREEYRKKITHES
jgi:hypothetical protein